MKKIITTKIKKNAFGEYEVHLFIGTKHQSRSTYYTDDKQDAIDTAKLMKIKQQKRN